MGLFKDATDGGDAATKKDLIISTMENKLLDYYISKVFTNNNTSSLAQGKDIFSSANAGNEEKNKNAKYWTLYAMLSSRRTVRKDKTVDNIKVNMDDILDDGMLEPSTNVQKIVQQAQQRVVHNKTRGMLSRFDLFKTSNKRIVNESMKPLPNLKLRDVPTATEEGVGAATTDDR